jgi:MoxR-like ATPase
MPSLQYNTENCIKAFGFPPNTRNNENETKLYSFMQTDRANTRLLIHNFLVSSGIPPKDANQALDQSLVKAYLASGYLHTWRNRVNPHWALLGDMDDDSADAEAGAGDGIQSEGNSASGAAAGMTAAQTERWLKDLFRQIEGTVGKLTQAKLDGAVIRLDPTAKDQIRELARSAARNLVDELMPPRRIEIVSTAGGGASATNIGLQHKCFPKLLRAVNARDHRGFRLNVWLTGPTGSGKTTAAENVAKAMSLPFGADGSLDADYKVLGFRNAQGEVVSTEFLRIYTGGGIYVADEIDNWLPSALLALNSALANGFVSTPGGLVRRHPDACVIACANTWGHGATNDYVGRTKLDAASLDRFHPKIHWPVDEALEKAVATAQWGRLGEAWHNVILAARSAAARQGLKVIVSPRATFSGLALLQAGFTPEETAEQVLKAGIDEAQYNSLRLDDTLTACADVVASLPKVSAIEEYATPQATVAATPDIISEGDDLLLSEDDADTDYNALANALAEDAA